MLSVAAQHGLACRSRLLPRWLPEDMSIFPAWNWGLKPTSASQLVPGECPPCYPPHHHTSNHILPGITIGALHVQSPIILNSKFSRATIPMILTMSAFISQAPVLEDKIGCCSCRRFLHPVFCDNKANDEVESPRASAAAAARSLRTLASFLRQ